MSKMNHSTQWSSSDVGGLCWVSDPAQAYIEARVTSVEKGVVRAEASDGRTFDVDLQLPLKPPSRKQKEPPRRILQRVPLTTNNGVENMDNLQSLQEASILDNIQHRFRMDLIYTNTGPILIAMNPFKSLAASITPSLRRRRERVYYVASMASGVDGVTAPPRERRRIDGFNACAPRPRDHTLKKTQVAPHLRRRRDRPLPQRALREPAAPLLPGG